MTVEELKNWSEEQYSEIKEMIKKMSATLYGNGSAGLCEDNRNIKSDIIDHEMRVIKIERQLKKKTIKEEALKLLISAIVILVPVIWILIQMSEKVSKLAQAVGVN